MATVLYTPEVLGLAVDLAGYPLDEALPLLGQARSATCGSQLRLGLSCDAQGRVMRVGLAAQACAIGQAAAAIFAKGATGKTPDDIDAGAQAIRLWLAKDGAMPEWPGFEVLAAVPDYPARHGAVLLAWNAASQALSSTHQQR
ncbi:iron-sulfur cluster assembly scaffold protein [Novosphingobium profundi]|uniref:iron-sulfur cluster assembly scaffold protein n=1 Tax=Novosphingobium profundi TaxID=1774954 RepID=UPI001BDA1335|nr:iron-sulfur cluster assembly scaffold protein [Novosphingobium profundi]MBT0668974.1 iron-sulfur cluster assembly scaffold protein [Novosphingobium profundi]